MGKFGKWVAGGLGWAFFGPIGGILGKRFSTRYRMIQFLEH